MGLMGDSAGCVGGAPRRGVFAIEAALDGSSAKTRKPVCYAHRMPPQIIPLSTAVEPELSTPSPDKVLSGTPQHSVRNYFTDPSGQFFAGRWSSTPGKWRIRYTESELCLITSGQVVLTDDEGTAISFGPGDAFVIPAGFSGTWEVVVECTKIYAIHEKIP